MQPTFDRPFFSENGKFLFKIKNYFSFIKFYFLAHIIASLLVLITFRRYPEGLEKSKIADPRSPPFDNHVITMSYDVITSCCGLQRRHLWTYYLSSKSHCHSFHTWEIMEGEGGRNPSPLPQKTKKQQTNKKKKKKKKPGQERVNGASDEARRNY